MLQKCHLRPYADENTAFRSICEVKHLPAQSVVRSGRTREAWVLYFSFCLENLSSFYFVFRPNGDTTQKAAQKDSVDAD